MTRILFIALFIGGFCGVKAQHSLKGTILDAETNETLIGAIIIEKGKTTGVVSDLDGTFSIQLDTLPTTIEVSYTGRILTVINVTDLSPLNIELKPESLQLGEVVVTAFGLERSSKALGYAVQQLEGNQINEVKAVNFLDNLSGKLAGVQITAGATGVGSTSKITIRGETSFTSNNPLFVVDGIPINNNTVVNITNEAAAGFQEVDFGNGGMDINPNDIASISILKGPSAAALYGTRASNGVIIIKTKDGSETKGLGISLNSTTYLESAFQLPEFQNEFGQGNNGQFAFIDGLGGGINDNITYSYGPELDVGNVATQFDSPVRLADGRVVRGGDVAVHGGASIEETPLVSHPDNVKNFYQTGITTINNLAFSNQLDKGSYRLSLTDLRSESIIPGVNLDRQSLSARMRFEPTRKLSFSTAFQFIHSQSDNRPNNGYGSENVNYDLTAWLGRQTNVDAMKDYWQPGLEDIQHFSYNYTFFDNPYFILNENRNSFDRDRLFGHVMASYQVSSALSISLRSGMDYSDENRQFRRAFSTNRFKNGGYAENAVFFREINTDFLINYQKQFGSFQIDLTAGGNRMDQEASINQIQTVSLAQPGIFKLSNAASPLEIFEEATDKRINSLYGLAKLSFRNFVYLDITGRNDWSSALATPTSTDNTSFFYPSFSSSFVLSNAVELPTTISFLKVRASWARVGNDTAPFNTSGVFIAQTPVNGAPTFSDQSSLPNPNLLPEQTTALEFGADIRLFNDAVGLDLTYYDLLTENQILSLPIALSSGYDERILNGGSVRAKGWELILSTNRLGNKQFSWNGQFNFSTNRAVVESLPEEAGRLTLAYSRVYDNPNQTVWFQVREGDRIGDMWGTGYLRNENGAYVVSADGRFIADNSLKKLGNYNPDFILGFVNQFSSGPFSLRFVLDWHQGGILVSRTLALAGTAGQLIETVDRPQSGIIVDGVVNVGSTENPQYVENTTPIPAETYYRQYYDRNHEEHNVYDASYLKIREVSLGFKVPKPMLEGTFLRRIEGLSIALVSRNLFAFSEIPHFDPEQLSVQGQNFIRGVEDMAYPTSRSIGLNLNVNF